MRFFHIPNLFGESTDRPQKCLQWHIHCYFHFQHIQIILENVWSAKWNRLVPHYHSAKREKAGPESVKEETGNVD